MGFFDPSQFCDHFFHDKEQGGFFFFIFSGDNNNSFLLNLFLNLFLNFNQFREGNPIFNNLKIFLNNSNQIFKVRLSAYIRFKETQ